MQYDQAESRDSPEEQPQNSDIAERPVVNMH